ncbi:peptide ABC transporter substrate-binding protein [Yinghuangia seranimata]|uniref:peptide ABC transporter substrate-binding protein n=1 Tax=Yinghuangia seranimata TaxID=408067 RepID=UPI00248AA109|nr:ABC transporter substrate-binding protein [Yinghuangia seranimata]MDI2128908.1 ABC transporter substrate-binding protein [Yinghuangia seranimata]
MRGSTRVKIGTAVVAIALAATACSSSDDDTKSSGSTPGASAGGDGGTATGVYSYQSGEPQNPLQPANANENQGGRILQNLFRGLYTFDAKDGHPVPAMAQSVDTKDAQNYTIKIKSGWTFHDGTPVTAKSFVDAWNWGANAKNKQLSADPWFADIEGFKDVHPESGDPTAQTMSGLKVVDDTTFTVKLYGPVSSFTYKLGYIAFAPLPQAFYSDPAKFGENPVGNGPYQMDGAWEHKVHLKVKTFPGYKGDDKPKNGGIDFKFYTSAEAAYTDLVSNNLDVMDQVPTTQLGKYKQDLGSRAVDQPQASIQMVGFALYDPAWSAPGKEKVRQGISLAIDRDTITKTVFKGSRSPADSWVSPGINGFLKGTCGDFCKFDKDKAKALVAEGGGVPNNKITLIYNGDANHKEWVDATCNSIRQTLNVECVGEPKPTFKESRDIIQNKKVTGGMFRTGWQADYPLNGNFLADIYRTGAASNDSGYSNPKFDDLTKQADANPDLSAAVKQYQDAEKLLANDMPQIPLWYYQSTTGYSTKVSNVTYVWNGDPDFTNVVVKK